VPGHSARGRGACPPPPPSLLPALRRPEGGYAGHRGLGQFHNLADERRALCAPWHERTRMHARACACAVAAGPAGCRETPLTRRRQASRSACRLAVVTASATAHRQEGEGSLTAKKRGATALGDSGWRGGAPRWLFAGLRGRPPMPRRPRDPHRPHRPSLRAGQGARGARAVDSHRPRRPFGAHCERTASALRAHCERTASATAGPGPVGAFMSPGPDSREFTG